MHIPDAYLSPATQAAAFAVMAPIWFVAARHTRRELTTKQAPLLSMGAAFCFAVQMFNIPAVGGTTAHPLGAALLAILVGPWAAVLGLSVSLLIQALLFGDGGILSYGANCWDMAVVAVMVSYGLYRLFAGSSGIGTPRRIAAAGFAAYAGTVTASLSAGILLGIQPAIAHDAAGHALYCPFGLGVAVPAMVLSHLLAAGPAEALITVAALAYIGHSFPEMLRPRERIRVGQVSRLSRTLVWVLVLTPLGLIASGDAFGEWDLASLKRLVGYVPAGAGQSRRWFDPLLPDYGFAGHDSAPWAIAGYLISAAAGCLAIALFTRAAVRRSKVDVAVDAEASRVPVTGVPAWLLGPNAPVPIRSRTPAPWLERTVLRTRSAVARTVVAEQFARLPGLLQAASPEAKTAAFLASLIAVALAQQGWPLALALAGAVGLAAASRLPLWPYACRVGAATLFFGLVLALPVSLAAVTPGAVAFRVLGVGISATGLQIGGRLLLRLAAGIGLAILWHSTTRWHDLLASLRSFGVPAGFLVTASLAYRYLFVTIETLAEMVEARTSRQVGAMSKDVARRYGGAGAAILFSKSLAFTEEVHWAMRARLGDGRFTPSAAYRWRPADLALVLACAAFLTLSIVLRVAHAV